MVDLKWRHCSGVGASETYLKKEVSRCAGDVECPTRYWLAGIKKFELEKRSLVESQTISLFLCSDMLQATIEKLFEQLKGCGRMTIKMKIGDYWELCCFPVAASYWCDIPEQKDVSSVKLSVLVLKPCIPGSRMLDKVKPCECKGVVWHKMLNSHKRCSWSALRTSSSQREIRKRE